MSGRTSGAVGSGGIWRVWRMVSGIAVTEVIDGYGDGWKQNSASDGFMWYHEPLN